MYRTVGELIEALQKHDKDLPVMLEVLIDDPPGYGWGADAFLKTLRLGPYGVKPRYLKLSGETE